MNAERLVTRLIPLLSSISRRNRAGSIAILLAVVHQPRSPVRFLLNTAANPTILNREAAVLDRLRPLCRWWQVSVLPSEILIINVADFDDHFCDVEWTESSLAHT